MAITVATYNFLANCFHILNGTEHLLPELQVSCGGPGNFFKYKLAQEVVQKPAGSSVGYAHLPLQKLLQYKT
jgi:hypothetical protein